MAAVSDSILKIRTDLRTLNTRLRDKSEERDTLVDKIAHGKLEIDDTIKVKAEEYREEEVQKIEEKYEERIEELKESIEEIEVELNTKDVDETEDLVAARKTMEYLNTSAIIVNRFYEELKKVSTTYFIDIAYSEKQFNLAGFKKQFKTLPRIVKDLKVMNTDHIHPFSLLHAGGTSSKVNIKVYLGGFFASPYVALTFPYAVSKAISRAKRLHGYARLYHRMMHTLASLKENTDEEINRIFEGLLTLKSERLETKLAEKKLALADLQDEMNAAIEGIKFDEKKLRMAFTMELNSLETSLDKLNEEVEGIEISINELEDELSAYREQLTDELREEVARYMKGLDPEKRLVSVPEKLLYMTGLERNSFFELKPALYIHNDRNRVGMFIRTVVFQLRNIMKWGAVQYRVEDLLGAEFIVPLALPQDGKAKSQDIFIYSLADERDDLIESMHDLLLRRRTQILSKVDNISDYNILQDEAGSAILPYQFVFMVVNGALKLDQKLIQLIHTGAKVGLCFYIFILEENLNLSTVKTVETYFHDFVELTNTGMTTVSPEEYRERLERKEADKKLNI